MNPEYDFGYQFADGFKWAKDMTRDELLVVIQTLVMERDYARREARNALVAAKHLVLT